MFSTRLFVSLILVSLGVSISPIQGQCHTPPPSSNFTLHGYYGLWYEIGKFQTPGGAVFEKDCVCTTIYVEPVENNSSGDSTALNSCRKNTPTGHYVNATGQLIDMIKPGQWKEKFFPFVPPVNYTVIYMDKDFAVEYDCGVSFGVITNYCIHIMARTPTVEFVKIKPLIDFATKLGLNTNKLPLQLTSQDKCW